MKTSRPTFKKALVKTLQNLIFGILFFKNIISGIQHFYIYPHVPVDIIRVFFLISSFLAESLRKWREGWGKAE